MIDLTIETRNIRKTVYGILLYLITGIKFVLKRTFIRSRRQIIY